MATTPSGLIQRMDAEWQHLVNSPATAEALERWRLLEPALAGYRDLTAIRGAVHDRTDLAVGDELLAALTRLAAVTGHGDELAARVVLQLLVPGAIRLSQRLAGMFGDQATSEAVVLAELTIGIRTYPWQRRPRRIAANLLLDCRQRLTRGYRRARPEICAGLTLHDPARTSDDHCEQQVGLHDLLWWARRHGILSKLEAQLLVASHVADIPMHQLASRFGRSRSSLFAIRASAERRLRHALRDEAVAAPDGGAAGHAAPTGAEPGRVTTGATAAPAPRRSPERTAGTRRTVVATGRRP